MIKILQPEEIEFEVEDMEKEKHVLKLTTIPSETLLGIIESISDENLKTRADVLCKQMVAVFGGQTKDYKKFDVRVLNQVLSHVTKEIQNPIKTQ